MRHSCVQELEVEERVPIRIGLHTVCNEMVLSIPDEAKNEFPTHFDDLVNVKSRARKAFIKHYHADGGAELIGKSILDALKKIEVTYCWNSADTPELNATSDWMFRTLSERCLRMLLQFGLSIDFWRDCYEASDFITKWLPTKTSQDYITPLKGCKSKHQTYRTFEYGGVKPTFEFQERIIAKTGKIKCNQAIQWAVERYLYPN